MLSKLLLVGLIALFVLKLFYQTRFGQLRRSLDKFVNLLLLAFLISYGAQLLYKWMKGWP